MIFLRFGFLFCCYFLIVITSIAISFVSSDDVDDKNADAAVNNNNEQQQCANVTDVTVVKVKSSLNDTVYTFHVTINSSYETGTGWNNYADEWQIRGYDNATATTAAGTSKIIEEDGMLILGSRTLKHPHVDEQPFTRSLNVRIPKSTKCIVVAARDSIYGYCGEAYEFVLLHEEDADDDHFDASAAAAACRTYFTTSPISIIIDEEGTVKDERKNTTTDIVDSMSSSSSSSSLSSFSMNHRILFLFAVVLFY